MPGPTTEKISAMTPAADTDLAATTAAFEVSIDVTTTPATRSATIGVIRDFLASQATGFKAVTLNGGSVVAVAGLGCNGKAAQTAAASGGAVVTTTPALASYGYTLAQAEAILTLLNNIRAALVANGIMS